MKDAFMIKKGLRRIVLLVLALSVVGFTLFKMNPPPTVPAQSPQQASGAPQPYVVKLHAQWCLVCMLTKGVWSELQTTYAGRVNLVVFDLTTKEKVEASRVEAKRLGLDAFFDDHGNEPGAIYVLDGVSKEVKESFHGSRKVDEYKSAIDGLLKELKK
jgi:hypothetical protein